MHDPSLCSCRQESFFILLETVQQEDRVIHRNTKLKDCYQCLCQIRNFTQENIRSHVIQDRDSDTEQEQDRHHKGCSGNLQHDERKQCCDRHVDRQFLQTQILISVTTPDIPLIKHCLSAMARMFVTASIASSEDVVLSKVPASLWNRLQRRYPLNLLAPCLSER